MQIRLETYIPATLAYKVMLENNLYKTYTHTQHAYIPLINGLIVQSNMYLPNTHIWLLSASVSQNCVHRYIYMCIGIDNRIFIQSSYRETQSWSKAQTDENKIHTHIFSYLFFGIDLTKSYTYI